MIHLKEKKLNTRNLLPRSRWRLSVGLEILAGDQFHTLTWLRG